MTTPHHTGVLGAMLGAPAGALGAGEDKRIPGAAVGTSTGYAGGVLGNLAGTGVALATGKGGYSLPIIGGAIGGPLAGYLAGRTLREDSMLDYVKEKADDLFGKEAVTLGEIRNTAGAGGVLGGAAGAYAAQQNGGDPRRGALRGAPAGVLGAGLGGVAGVLGAVALDGHVPPPVQTGLVGLGLGAGGLGAGYLAGRGAEKTARNWTPAQRRHYFKMLNAGEIQPPKAKKSDSGPEEKKFQDKKIKKAAVIDWAALFSQKD